MGVAGMGPFVPWVKRLDCGNISKYTLYTHQGRPPDPVLKVDDEHYMDRQGHIWKYRRSETKGDDIRSLKRSFARLRDLINANATDPERMLFVTYTYDTKSLGYEPDLKQVSKHMRTMFCAMRKDGYRFEYIYTVERQGRGVWHTHCIYFFPTVAPYLPGDYLSKVWGHGFVSVSQRFKDSTVANVGAYLCADLTYSGGAGADEHKRVKDSRLLNYASGTHLYRCSRGIRRPVEVPMDYGQYLEETEGRTPIYEQQVVMRPPGCIGFHWYRYEHYDELTD